MDPLKIYSMISVLSATLYSPYSYLNLAPREYASYDQETQCQEETLGSLKITHTRGEEKNTALTQSIATCSLDGMDTLLSHIAVWHNDFCLYSFKKDTKCVGTRFIGTRIVGTG